MLATNRFVALIVILSVVTVVGGCSTTYQTAGPYEIVVHNGGLMCQPRQEFYFTGASSASNREHLYLGTCSTPQGLVRDFHLSRSSTDRSCYAISTDGASMVYLHRPRWCGAGEKAARKPGGVYLHSAREGDRLLYPESEISQVWGITDIGPNAIRVGWRGRTPSRTGAGCPQDLVINANGEETRIGFADPNDVTCRIR